MGGRARVVAFLILLVLAAACTAASTASLPPSSQNTSPAPSGTDSSPGATGSEIRDLGPALGLREDTFSYGVQPQDYDGDGWTDVLVIHHSGPKQLLRNDQGRGLSIATVLEDERHGRSDSHDCAWADVDRDGDPDVYCTKGAQRGRVRKWNELWIQGPTGVFEDRAAEYRVEDHLGRGRRPVFLDLNGDRYPDLFIGNESHRRDGRPTPNRTFVNVGGERFQEVDVGLTLEIGSHCVQAVDVDVDGLDDLILCSDDALVIYLRRGDRFVPATAELGVSPDKAKWAIATDLNGDERPDLAVVRKDRAQVQLGEPGGTFGPVRWQADLEAGNALAVGDLDGLNGRDLLVVQGCLDDENVTDVVFLNRGDGTSFRPRPLTEGLGGCGDVAAAFDFDDDGRDEFYVLNGRPPPGSDQLLTMGDWQPPS